MCSPSDCSNLCLRLAIRSLSPVWGAVSCACCIPAHLFACCTCCADQPPSSCLPDGDSIDGCIARLFRWSTIWPDADSTTVREHFVAQPFLGPAADTSKWSTHVRSLAETTQQIAIIGLILIPVGYPCCCCTCCCIDENGDDILTKSFKNTRHIPLDTQPLLREG